MSHVRHTRRGLVYLRRSDDRQQTSFDKQLAWAIGAARAQGVALDASIEDVRHMQQYRLHAYKAIRLDDGITGGDLQRKGLTALFHDAVADTEVSHVFAFRRDRLGRPEQPAQMLLHESRLHQAGVTLVTSEGVFAPKPDGGSDLGSTITSLIEYHNAGEFRRAHAEQMIRTQLVLAKQGLSTGGNPPYGFVRALIAPQGNVLEILAAGKHVKQDGCHVVWIPDPNDESKVKTWLYMLELKRQGWGYKRIANYLNDVLKLPSPHAGRTRTDHGVKHQVSGKWHMGTVKALLENRTILAISDYGRRSEGSLRRVGKDGPRYVMPEERNSEQKPKTVWNDPANVVTSKRSFEPLIDPRQWQTIHEKTRQRGRNQAGIPRASDPAKYPLSCRVVDLTDNCGSVMYARTNGQRRLYQCGRYMNSSGSICNNNQVDAEGLLRFVLATLGHLIDQWGAREQIRTRLLTLATQQQPSEPDIQQVNRGRLEKEIATLEHQLSQVQRNLAIEEDPQIRDVIREEYRRIRAELDDAKSQLEQAQVAKPKATAPQEAIEQAMSLLDQLHMIASDPAARARINPMLQQISLWVGLQFVEAIKGKKRQVRRLTSGLIAFGPMPLRGSIPANPSVTTINNNAGRMVQPAVCRQEGISSTKVNRGDCHGIETLWRRLLGDRANAGS